MRKNREIKRNRRKTDRDRQAERQRQTDRDRQTHTHRQRQTDRHTDRERDRQRQTDRQTNRELDRQALEMQGNGASSRINQQPILSYLHRKEEVGVPLANTSRLEVTTPESQSPALRP